MMATFEQALAELAYQHTRENVVQALTSEQLRIAASVFERVADEFYRDNRVDYGTFDNCREWGLTVTAGDWTFCAYEHRNSDEINLEGCLTEVMPHWGPYGGVNKFDTLAAYPWREYSVAASAMIGLVALALKSKEGKFPIARPQLKAELRASCVGRGRRG